MKIKIISALLAVSLFAFFVLPVLAQEATPTPTPAPTLTPTPTPNPNSTNLTTGLACVQTAVGKRDDAIISAFSAFSTATSAALSARKTALVAAWGITDKKARRAAIKKAWNDFTAATKTARRTLNSARKTAWTQYAKDVRACRSQGASTSDDYGTQGHEANL